MKADPGRNLKQDLKLTGDITVIVPTYNRASYLRLALRTALDQTVRDFEVIVVDDGSTDDSVTIVEEIQKEDSRLSIVKLDKNRGPSVARNAGIKGCKSKYVTFLDSDDLFARERLESLLSRLEAGNGHSVVYSDWVRVGPEETVVRAEWSRGSFRPEGKIFPSLLAGNFRFTAGLIALPRLCFDEVGLYDESLRWAEDTDMVLRLSSKFPFLFEHNSTYGWRSHGGSSSNVMSRQQRLRDETQVLEKHLVRNLGALDPRTKRQAFERLFGCYIGSGQWTRLLKMSFVDWQALISMVTIPSRMVRGGKASRDVVFIHEPS